MDDLRWVLLMVGVVVVVAIYFSGRFESEDWARERKHLREGRQKTSGKKKPSKKILGKEPVPATVRPVVKKEPSMSSVPEVAMATPAATTPVEKAATQQETPSKQTVQVQQEAPVKQTATIKEDNVKVSATAEAKVETPPAEEKTSAIKAASSVETGSSETAQEKDAAEEIDEKIDLDIEDEITEVEIPVDLAVAEAEIHIDDIEQSHKPEQTEMPLEIEPLVLSVSVLADESEGFSGQELKEALEAEGLAYGAMRIFHFYDPDKEDIVDTDDAVFSAANLLEPGYFELEKMDGMRTPGLMLFCQLPGPLESEKALELMLDKGRGLAVRLHGQMCDDKRNVFTTQAKTYYLDKIATFNREVELARKKAFGSV